MRMVAPNYWTAEMVRALPDLFVVDPAEARTLGWTRMQRLLLAVEVWTPGATFPVVEEETLRWAPDGAATPVTIVLGDLFAHSPR